MNVVSAVVLLLVTLTLAVPSSWYALKLHRLVGLPFLSEGDRLVDVLSWVFAVWTLAMLALVGLSFRRRFEPTWFVVLSVLTVLFAGVHLELAHSRVHFACIREGPLGITVNCAPWLPDE